MVRSLHFELTICGHSQIEVPFLVLHYAVGCRSTGADQILPLPMHVARVVRSDRLLRDRGVTDIMVGLCDTIAPQRSVLYGHISRVEMGLIG
jgi:hypothetical protein